MRNLLGLFTLLYIKNLQFVNSDKTTTPLSLLQSDVPKSNSNFDAKADAAALKNAMAGFGVNEDPIIEILGNRTHSQRLEIAKLYEKSYGKNLIHQLRDEISGNFRDSVVALLTDTAEYLAKELHQAISSFFFANDDTLIEILATRNKDELKPIIDAYEKLYKETLKSVAENYATNDFGIFLIKLVSDKLRDASNSTDEAKAKDQVNLIPKTPADCAYNDTKPFVEFLSKESFAQIKLVSETFEKNNNKSLENQLEESCPDDRKLLKAYSTIVSYANDPAEYYAKELYEAESGYGTDDNKYIRIIVTRSDIDLNKIKSKYNELYGKSLESSADDEISGFYEKLILKLIRNAN